MNASDPIFFHELRAKVRRGDAPVGPLPKALLRRRLVSQTPKSIVYSLLLHASFVALAFLQWAFPGLLLPATDHEALLRLQESRTAIRVDLVALPNMTLDQMVDIDPTEKVGEAEAPAPEAPKISETVMKLPEPAAPKIETAKKPDTKKQEALSRKRLDALRANLRADQRRQELSQKLEGKNTGGRPLLAGNIISEGYSVTGDVATDQDIYAGKAKAHMRRHWSVPAWMTASALRAQVLIKVAPDGRIVSRQFIQNSGNEDFDRYVEESIEAANPLPPPPDTLQRVLIEEGIVWGFPE